MPKSEDISPRLLQELRDAFGPDVDAGDLTLIEGGNYANATVYRLKDDARDLIIKEFYSSNWLIRHTLGRLLIWREIRALTLLDGIPGIPAGGRRLGPFALSEAFIEGVTLGHFYYTTRTRLPKPYFLALEQLVKQMHEAGYAHLDLRNLKNVIYSSDAKPYLIDFQAGLRTRHLPRFLRRMLENSDVSGFYKCWKRVCEEPLTPAQEAFVRRFQGIRKFWIFKGYWLSRTWKKLTQGIDK